MKNKYSFFAFCIVGIVLLCTRISYSDLKSEAPLKVTTWDALGYYMYLPSIFIYQDLTELKWFFDNDVKYSLSGGWVYQANKYKNGNYVFKYLGGVSIIQAPFFFIGHWIAKITNYEEDGFSQPYQYAIAFGVVFLCILAILLLRKILLIYFDDVTTALTLLLLLLASNFIQYVSVDGGMSHGYIFPLYVLLLYTTLKWHQKPNLLWASLTGFIIGLATICRPTEAIMLFIPLLWNTHTRELSKAKWQLVKKNKKHVVYMGLFLFLGILPQMIYWKIATGSFVYDVGSKWDFLMPHLRVLFGWEKGWFIYTPITIFFVMGLFFIKKFPFKKSVLTFCLLNIYIIISWHDWRYGGSYSARALVQSYPVFALPLAALIQQISLKKWRVIFYALGLYLLLVNVFQIKQYNNTIIHYDDMNRKYYGSVYLNPNPTPLDMSLLDTDEQLKSENKYLKETITVIDSKSSVQISPGSSAMLIETTIGKDFNKGFQTDTWIKVELVIQVNKGFSGSYIRSELQCGDSIKHTKIRLFSPISQNGQANDYAFYQKVPDYFKKSSVRLYISTIEKFEGTVKYLKITFLKKKVKIV